MQPELDVQPVGRGLVGVIIVLGYLQHILTSCVLDSLCPTLGAAFRARVWD